MPRPSPRRRAQGTVVTGLRTKRDDGWRGLRETMHATGRVLLGTVVTATLLAMLGMTVGGPRLPWRRSSPRTSRPDARAERITYVISRAPPIGRAPGFPAPVGRTTVPTALRASASRSSAAGRSAAETDEPARTAPLAREAAPASPERPSAYPAIDSRLLPPPDDPSRRSTTLLAAPGAVGAARRVPALDRQRIDSTLRAYGPATISALVSGRLRLGHVRVDAGKALDGQAAPELTTAQRNDVARAIMADEAIAANRRTGVHPGEASGKPWKAPPPDVPVTSAFALGLKPDGRGRVTLSPLGVGIALNKDGSSRLVITPLGIAGSLPLPFGGGPSKAKRERDRAIDAEVRGRLARVAEEGRRRVAARASADSLHRVRAVSDSLASVPRRAPVSPN